MKISLPPPFFFSFSGIKIYERDSFWKIVSRRVEIVICRLLLVWSLNCDLFWFSVDPAIDRLAGYVWLSRMEHLCCNLVSAVRLKRGP